MGMFDYVLIEHPIQGVTDPAAMEWQTKDFDWPFMERYKITADGRLLEEIYHTEDRSDKTAPPGSLASVVGIWTPVHDGWRDTNYHGDLACYGAPPGWQRPEELVRIVARFTDGQLVSIRRLPSERDRTTDPASPAVSLNGETR